MSTGLGARLHPYAVIGPDVILGEDVEIGPFTLVEGPTRIGDRSRIGSHCHIGVATPLADEMPLMIGEDSLIRSHSIFYQGSVFGNRLTTGHRVTVREKCSAGTALMIGTDCDIQGHCRIGDYVRMHSHVQVNHRATIGDFVWLFPYVLLTNDPRPPSDMIEPVTVEAFAALGARSIVLPGVTIGRDALVGAGTLVTRDIPAETLCLGVPGRLQGSIRVLRQRGSILPAYPWRRHFHRGYPPEIVAQWRFEFPEG